MRGKMNMYPAINKDVVNINNANNIELQKLIHVGPNISEGIIAFRNVDGPYGSIYDLLKIKGMTINKLKDIVNQGILEF